MIPTAKDWNSDGYYDSVLCEDFRWDDIEPDESLSIDDQEKQKEGFRIAMRTIFDILIPNNLTCGDPKANLQCIGRKAVILAFAIRHHSIDTKKAAKLAELIGSNPVQIRKRLQWMRKTTGISSKGGTKNK